MNLKNILWIDSAVKDYLVFVESVNSNTQPLVYSSSNSTVDIKNVLHEFTTIDRIGIVFSHTDTFLNEPFYSETNTTFFIDTIRNYQVKNIDFLACDTLRNPVWKDFYQKLHAETGVIVGASENSTGNLKYGGDWILESTSEDIERIYFTNTIQYYTYILGVHSVTMVLRSDGIWGTGKNSIGQLANGTYIDRNTFQNISQFQSTLFKSRTVKLISAIQGNVFVLMTDNTLWYSGGYSNLFSQISFPGTGTIISITSESTQTIILTSDNELWARGDGTIGQFGQASYEFSNQFIKLVGITGTIKTVSCGNAHTAVLTTSNILWVSGNNTYGQLGLGDTVDRSIFTQINISSIVGINGRIAEFVSCGYGITVLSMTDGTLWGCGLKSYIGINVYGGENQLVFKRADEITSTYNNGTRRVKMLSSSNARTYVLMTDGTVWKTGNPILSDESLYTYYKQVIMPTTITSIICGYSHVLLLGSNNVLYGYGSNRDGQLGQGTTNELSSFTNILTDVLLLPNTENDSLQTLSQNVSSVTCFPAGTLVKSDQGKIPIQQLIPGQHTLRGKIILAVPETYNMDKDMVCIEKDALRKNCPHQITFISPRHKIYYKGKMKAAYRFVGHQKGVSYVPYQGEKLYNVLLEEYETMNVHGMICETLHPANPVAIYMKKLKQCLQ